ncbi:HigA family addiction module antitoxin, partial [Acinetobacter boissieri]
LKEEYMLPLELSSNALAKKLGVTPTRINDIVLERRAITADTALRLARFFGGDAESWLNLQHLYDLKIAYEKAGKTIEETITPYDTDLAFA